MKRKITLFVLLSTGIILGYLSFITWFVGFLIAKYLGGKAVGQPSKLGSWFIPLGKYKVHLHHWILSSCAMVLFALFRGAHVLSPDLFYGFFGGIAFHGIYLYSDWHKILIRKQGRSLIAAKNLAIGEFCAATNFPETEED